MFMSCLPFFSQFYIILVSGNIDLPSLPNYSLSPASNKYDLSTVKSLLSGAAPLGSPLATAVREKLKTKFGRDVIIGQGVF
jgi:hypothetical protein